MPLSASAGARSLRARFAETSAATASRPRLVTMLYDRMVRDLHEAAAALERADHYGAHTALVHAQEIVEALRAALDPTVWPGARGLGQLYDFVHERMVAANLTKDPKAVADALTVVEPLRDAWHEAFRSLGDAT